MTDPAFAAVERVRVAYKAIGDVLNEEPDVVTRSAAWEAKNEAVCAVHSEAEWEMVQTVPTTRAGAVAMITAYLEHNAGMGEPDAEHLLLESLAEAMPNLV
jgi:hypothetical protein